MKQPQREIMNKNQWLERFNVIAQETLAECEQLGNRPAFFRKKFTHETSLIVNAGHARFKAELLQDSMIVGTRDGAELLDHSLTVFEEMQTLQTEGEIGLQALRRSKGQ
jgi:hypothetical protein